MLYLLTGSLPWAVTANYDLWNLAHGRQAIELWSVTSYGVEILRMSLPGVNAHICVRLMLSSVVRPQSLATCCEVGKGWQAACSATPDGGPATCIGWKCMTDGQPCRCKGGRPVNLIWDH